MPNTPVRAQLTSGQLGEATGVSADTIRHYEKLGLLKKAVRSDGGYRLYQPGAITRVQTVRCALKAGFSLAELSGIFRERDAGGTPCRRVAALAAEKVESLDKQMRELNELRDWLASTITDWQQRIEHTPAGERVGLLDSLREGLPESGNQAPKGMSNESTRSHLRPMRGRSTGSDKHARSRSKNH